MDELDNTFKGFLKIYLDARIEGLWENLLKDEEYQAIREEQAALFKEIEAALPEKLKEKIHQYAELQHQLSGLEHPFIYQNAVSDIVRVVKHIFGDAQAPTQE